VSEDGEQRSGAGARRASEPPGTGRQLDGTGLKRLHRDWRRRTEGRVALLLDGVSSGFNVGSILRTAAAERVEHLWFTDTATPPTAASVRKTALGTERYLTWTIGAGGAECAADARAAGWHVVGLELSEGAVPLHELAIDPGTPVCLAVGHEDHGLAASTVAACDALAYLPQLGRVGSLNVAVATAIGVYEIRRREWSSSP
jgi:tRNA (guanosine-2'-O-)-methyltransferase